MRHVWCSRPAGVNGVNEVLAASRDVFRKMIVEATSFSILLLDENGDIVLWNSGAEAIFGYRAEDVIGRNFDLLFLEVDRQSGAPAKELAKARAEGRADDTRWHVGKAGRLRFMDGMTMPVHDDDGRLVGFSKFGRDVTERHQTERRLAAQLSLTNL